MKRTNIIYWIFTGFFAAFMLFSAFTEIQNSPAALKLIADMGYPAYLNPFLGVTKILGVIALLVPGFPRLKEWAYAGFVIDLTGATYSMMYSKPNDHGYFFMIVFFAVVAVSYIFYHKKLKATV